MKGDTKNLIGLCAQYRVENEGGVLSVMGPVIEVRKLLGAPLGMFIYCTVDLGLVCKKRPRFYV